MPGFQSAAFQYASTLPLIAFASARPVTAHWSLACTSAYRCTASFSHPPNWRSPLNGRSKSNSQRIKPPQSNRPVHRYPVPGFQRVVKRLWSRFFCNFSLAKQRKVNNWHLSRFCAALILVNLFTKVNSKYIYFEQPELWNHMVARAMEKDLSWGVSKKRYEELYNTLIGR